MSDHNKSQDVAPGEVKSAIAAQFRAIFGILRQGIREIDERMARRDYAIEATVAEFEFVRWSDKKLNRKAWWSNLYFLAALVVLYPTKGSALIFPWGNILYIFSIMATAVSIPFAFGLHRDAGFWFVMAIVIGVSFGFLPWLWLSNVLRLKIRQIYARVARREYSADAGAEFLRQPDKKANRRTLWPNLYFMLESDKKANRKTLWSGLYIGPAVVILCITFGSTLVFPWGNIWYFLLAVAVALVGALIWRCGSSVWRHREDLVTGLRGWYGSLRRPRSW